MNLRISAMRGTSNDLVFDDFTFCALSAIRSALII